MIDQHDEETYLSNNYFEGLPAQAFLVHPGPYDPRQEPKVIRVDAGQSGYFVIAVRKTVEEAQAVADELNGGALAPEVAEAMLAGSMFGWLVPAADPATYRDRGALVSKSRLEKG